ncbi:MAG: hypothetical protein Q9203_003869, partial [Teloschistes exilis]
MADRRRWRMIESSTGKHAGSKVCLPWEREEWRWKNQEHNVQVQAYLMRRDNQMSLTTEDALKAPSGYGVVFKMKKDNKEKERLTYLISDSTDDVENIVIIIG